MTKRQRKIRRRRRRERQAKVNTVLQWIRKGLQFVGILGATLAAVTVAVGVLFQNPYRSLEILIFMGGFFLCMWLCHEVYEKGGEEE